MKFNYAPGVPGYGTKGVDGSAGSTGLSLYYSNYDGLADSATIQSRILSNLLLWSGSSDPLPENRVYQIGDLFTDKYAKIFKIFPDVYPYYEDTGMKLNASGFFEYLKDAGSSYERWSNIYDDDIKYIIDNVYKTSGGDYTQYPTDIYGILPEQFARVEYSDLSPAGDPNNRYPFTVYTTGEDDDNAFAIVFNPDTGIWGMGNVDSIYSLRDTKLSLDFQNLYFNGVADFDNAIISNATFGTVLDTLDNVISNIPVIINKAATRNQFTEDTADATVLTNHEINANSLFDDVFVSAPTSFTTDTSGTTVIVTWNKQDFFDDSSAYIYARADLIFYESDSYNETTVLYDPSSGIYTKSITDASTNSANPLTLYGLDASGTLFISNLKQGTDYNTFIKFTINGWERCSDEILQQSSGDRVDVKYNFINNSSSNDYTFLVEWYGNVLGYFTDSSVSYDVTSCNETFDNFGNYIDYDTSYDVSISITSSTGLSPLYTHTTIDLATLQANNYMEITVNQTESDASVNLFATQGELGDPSSCAPVEVEFGTTSDNKSQGPAIVNPTTYDTSLAVNITTTNLDSPLVPPDGSIIFDTSIYFRAYNNDAPGTDCSIAGDLTVKIVHGSEEQILFTATGINETFTAIGSPYYVYWYPAITYTTPKGWDINGTINEPFQLIIDHNITATANIGASWTIDCISDSSMWIQNTGGSMTLGTNDTFNGRITMAPIGFP